MTTKGCTVKELREFLAKLPDNMTVSVVKECNRGYETSTCWVPLVLPFDDETCYTQTFDTCADHLELGSR